MREITTESLREDLARLGAIVTQARVLHPTGLHLHGSGEVLTLGHVKALQEAGVKSLFLVEPGGPEAVASRALGGEEREPRLVAAGDLLLDDAVAADGRIVLPAGGLVDGASLEAVRACRGPLLVEKAGLEEGRRLAQEYLRQCPPQPARPPKPDTRLTQMISPTQVVLKPLLVPRAKVFVALGDEFTRSILTNTLVSEGHETFQFSSGMDAATALGEKPDVVLLDLHEASAFCTTARGALQLRGSSVLVMAPSEARGPELYRALMAGTNGSLPLPPRRDLVLEAVRSALRGMGRWVRVKPVLASERRKEARESGGVACRLADKFLSKPIPVSTATVLDISEGGLKIEYARPEWPHPWAIVGHSIHPKHYFYNYARANALGRDLTVSLTAPGGKTLEMMATFLHVTASGPFEIAGLQIRKSGGSVREHMTSVRGQKPSTIARKF